MAVNGARVPVGDEPVRLDTVEGNPRPDQYILINNPTGTGSAVDLGGEEVESGAGFELGEGFFIAPPLAAFAEEGVYAVAPEGVTVILHVFEAGL